MKRILILASLVTILISSCGGCMNQQPYGYLQSPTGQQMVNCNDGNGGQFLMDLVLFNMLMHQGGYGAVINHYHSNPNGFSRYNRSAYGNWRPYSGPAYGRSSYSGFRSSGNNPPPVFRNTSPSTPSSIRSTAPLSNYRSTPSSFRSSSSSFRSSGSSFRSSSRRR